MSAGPEAAPRRNERPAFALLGDEGLRLCLRRMHLVRRFEEAAEQSYIRGLIHGTMHLSIGQEASAAWSSGTPSGTCRVCTAGTRTNSE